MEMNDLITSHDDNLVLNKDYPQDLQGRRRESFASREQIEDIARNLDPLQLGGSRLPDTGAPIIGEGLVVESGNGRTLALRKALANHPEAWANYQEWLRKALPEFGIVEDISKIERPVLVRVRKTRLSKADRITFAQIANKERIAVQNAVELAVQDSERLNIGVLELLDVGERGDFGRASNSEFVRQFSAILTVEELNIFITKDGNLSQDGIRRMKNAIFHMAYRDIDLLERVAFSNDRELASLTNGLLEAAPAVARARAEMEAGLRSKSSIFDDMLDGLDLLDNSRLLGQTIEQFQAQKVLFGAPTPQALEMAKFLERSVGRTRALPNYLNAVANYISRSDLPGQAMLFEDAGILRANEAGNAAHTEIFEREPFAVDPEKYTDKGELKPRREPSTPPDPRPIRDRIKELDAQIEKARGEGPDVTVRPEEGLIATQADVTIIRSKNLNTKQGGFFDLGACMRGKKI